MTENFSIAKVSAQIPIVRNVPLHPRPSTALVKKGAGNVGATNRRAGGPGVSLLRNLTLNTGASLA